MACHDACFYVTLISPDKCMKEDLGLRKKIGKLSRRETAASEVDSWHGHNSRCRQPVHTPSLLKYSYSWTDDRKRKGKERLF